MSVVRPTFLYDGACAICAAEAARLERWNRRISGAVRCNGRGRISPWRRNHVVASVLSIVLGLHRAAFGYYIVSARKP